MELLTPLRSFVALLTAVNNKDQQGLKTLICLKNNRQEKDNKNRRFSMSKSNDQYQFELLQRRSQENGNEKPNKWPKGLQNSLLKFTLPGIFIQLTGIGKWFHLQQRYLGENCNEKRLSSNCLHPQFLNFYSLPIFDWMKKRSLDRYKV